jgi:hypothetical protein
LKPDRAEQTKASTENGRQPNPALRSVPSQANPIPDFSTA